MGKVWDVNYRSTKRKSQFLGSLVQSARLSHIVFHMTGARPPSIAEENMEKARPLRLLMRRAFPSPPLDVPLALYTHEKRSQYPEALGKSESDEKRRIQTTEKKDNRLIAFQDRSEISLLMF
jgi:hypothetical protein